MTLLLHAAATFLVLLTGFALLTALRRPGAAAPGWGEAAALSYLLGAMAIAVSMELLDRLSIPVRPLGLLVLPGAPTAMLLARGFLRRREIAFFPAGRPLDAFRGRRPWEWLLMALLASKLLYVLAMNLAELLRANDAFKVSLAVARTVYFEGSRADLALPGGYPPFPGLILGWFELLHPTWDEFALNLAHWNYYAALLLLVYAGLRRYTGRSIALAGAYALSALPLLLTHAALSGYADLPVAIYLAAACIYTHRYAREGTGDAFALALVFALCLPALKLEGTFPYLAIALLALGAAWLHHRRPLRPAAVAGAAAGAVALGVAALLALEATYGSAGPAALSAVWGNIVPGNRLGEIGGPLVEHFLWGYNNWILAGSVAAVAFPLLAAARARGGDLVLALEGGLLLAGFLYLYGVGGAYLWLVDGTVVNRSYLQIAPTLLFASLVLAAPLLDP